MDNSKKKKLSFKELNSAMKANAYFNQPNNFKKESEDHINISIHSETHIGKVFSPEYNKIINYPYIGKFNSVFSLWYWIRSKNYDDNIRRLTGNKLKAYVKNNNMHGSYVPNFKAIIAYATWLKVKSYKHIFAAIKELDPKIKLLSYVVIRSSGIRLSTNYAAMIIEIADEIIEAIRNNREPDFKKFVDDESKAGLMFIETVLGNMLSKEQLEVLKNGPVPVEDTSSGNEDGVEPEIENDGDIPGTGESSDPEELQPLDEVQPEPPGEVPPLDGLNTYRQEEQIHIPV